MAQTFHVRGVNPMGRIIEIDLVADSADEAKAKASEVGLRFVVVKSGDEPARGEEPPVEE